MRTKPIKGSSSEPHHALANGRQICRAIDSDPVGVEEPLAVNRIPTIALDELPKHRLSGIERDTGK